MTLGQQLPDHNTSVTTTACATSWILRHRRQHHRRDHTIAETTSSQRQHHRRDHAIAETTPSQRPHHRRDNTVADTTRAQSTLRTRIQGPGHPSQITVDPMRPKDNTIAESITWAQCTLRNRSKDLATQHRSPVRHQGPCRLERTGSGMGETPRTTPTSSQQTTTTSSWSEHSAPCGQESKDPSNQRRPHWTTATQRTWHIPTCATQHGALPKELQY